MKRFIVTGYLLIVFLMTIPAQTSTPKGDPDQLFYIATEQFQRGEYAGSFRAIDTWLDESPCGDHLEEAQFIKAASSWELNRRETSLLLIDFLKKWPASPYAEKAYYLLGCSAMEAGQYEDAMAYFKRCPESALSPAERIHYVFRMAYTAMKKGDKDLARQLFSDVASGESRYAASAGFFLAYMNYEAGNADAALTGFAPYADNNQLNASLPCLNVQLLYASGKNKEAIELARSLVNQVSDKVLQTEIIRILAAACFDNKDYDDSRQAYIAYMTDKPTVHPTDLYRIGILNYIAEEYDKAITRLSTLVDRKDAMGQSAMYHLGMCYLKNKNNEQARMSFEQASLLDYDASTKEKALYNYAVLCYETDYSAFNEQVNAFMRFLEAFPSSKLADKANSYLAEALLSSKDYQRSLSVINRVEKPDATLLKAKAKLLFLLGTESVSGKSFIQALDYFNQSLTLMGKNSSDASEIYYWKGEANFQLQRYKDAEADYKRYLEQPQAKKMKAWFPALYGMGYCLFVRENYSEALSRFESFTSTSGAEKDERYSDVLNRMGDCQHMLRRFEKAAQLYQKADKATQGGNDYAVFQQAKMLGLQKQYQVKLNTLKQFETRFNGSDLIDDALLETGKTYASMKEWALAISTFSNLMERFPVSPLSRKAGIQIALIQVNNQEIAKAIDSYKRVIELFPKSQEAQTALSDLKMLYVESNKVSDFINYTKGLDIAVAMDATEQDSLTFMAAESQLMNGNEKEAKAAFITYISLFPEGNHVIDSHYHLGKLSLSENNEEEAIRHLTFVANQTGHVFQVESVELLASLYLKQNRYEEATTQFSQLERLSSDKQTRQTAQMGRLRCCVKLENDDEMIALASMLLNDKELDADQLTETRYYRAKSYLKTNKATLAKTDLQALSKEVKTVYGAESRFLLADLYFKQNELKEAETLINQFIKDGTAHSYWLARSFLLLSDIYVQRKDNFQAKQYLLSLKENYKADDDIAGLIETRLNKLSQRNN